MCQYFCTRPFMGSSVYLEAYVPLLSVCIFLIVNFYGEYFQPHSPMWLILSQYHQLIMVLFVIHEAFPFLAHLSRRLMGELIVYQSLRRPSVVRRPSVRPQFQISSPLKPLGKLNSNFIWRLLRTRERKFVQMVMVT